MSAGRVATPAVGASYAQAPVSDDVQWQIKGLCSSGEYDPNLWYPDPPRVEQKSREAKIICQGCPVKLACADWALLHREIAGVWGGLSAEDRKRIWQGQAPKTQRRYHRRVPISA